MTHTFSIEDLEAEMYRLRTGETKEFRIEDGDLHNMRIHKSKVIGQECYWLVSGRVCVFFDDWDSTNDSLYLLRNGTIVAGMNTGNIRVMEGEKA